jgi:hypothetical protein
MFTDDPNCHDERTLYNKCRRGSWYTNRCTSDWQALETCNQKHKDEHYERFLRKKLGDKGIDLGDDDTAIGVSKDYWEGEGHHETARDLQSYIHLLHRKKRRK